MVSMLDIFAGHTCGVRPKRNAVVKSGKAVLDEASKQNRVESDLQYMIRSINA